ncbi:hypothetical protein [Methanolobus psychrotolerans]|uniref:hypothetical protein n=1 Tax=Methanolobus psychrotolerans TaxID=1874706 RepID=UPI000B918FC6|nr:hypothetical protein [Methanolobus psychrotolerans]
MTKKDKFSIFLEEKKEKWDKVLQNRGVFEEYPSHLNPKTDLEILYAYSDLGLINKYLGNKQKAVWFFKFLSTINVPSSRLEGISNEDDTTLVFSYGEYALKKGIFFDLSNSDLKTANRMFSFAAEDFIVKESTFDFWIKHKYYDDIAYGHLWRSYSLVRLNQYQEALELLVQVVPYLDKYKKTGVEMWRTVEYALTKALIPLCEYKLNPSEENLASAKKGIEDFIKSLREKKDKFEGYLYYFHLKEKFADVYEAEGVPADAKPAVKKAVEEKKIEFPVDDEEPGTIMITTLEGGYEDFLGSNSEVEKYCAEVSELGDFPNLALLMETYVTGSHLDAEPLTEECKRLLSMDGVEDWIRGKTEIVLEAAEDAKETGHGLYFYFAEGIVE